MREYRPTLFFSVPTFYAALLRAELPPDTFASARACVSAGERLPAEVYDAWRARFGVEILDGIGRDRDRVHGALEPAGREPRGVDGGARAGYRGGAARRRRACGRRRRAGRALGPDAVGGDGLLASASTSRGGPSSAAWFRTGDVYRRDADGFYEHCGREDDHFKVAGQWVMPARVEAVALPAPRRARGGRGRGGGCAGLVKPFVFVVPRGDRCRRAGDLELGVRRLVEASCRATSVRASIIVVPELPRTATGKLQRFRLRDRPPDRVSIHERETMSMKPEVDLHHERAQDGLLRRHGVAHRPGREVGGFLFVSGQGPLDPVTKTIVSDDIAEQTRVTLDNVRAVLEAGGTAMANVVRVGVYLRNMEDFPVFNRVFKEYFQGVQPARTTVEAAPPRKGVNVEIDAMAWLG